MFPRLDLGPWVVLHCKLNGTAALEILGVDTRTP